MLALLSLNTSWEIAGDFDMPEEMVRVRNRY